jgi:8-oxo-dGTP pyrophosphatase MutT (NUDIX family)
VIQVVSALIIRDRRILLQQRLARRDFPMMWENPGGKIEPTDANPVFALHRELDEELGHSVRAIEPTPVCAFTFHEGQFGLKEAAKVTFYRVRPCGPEEWRPQLLDAAGLGWFTVEDGVSLDMIPGSDSLWGHLHRLTPADPLFHDVWGAL